MTNEDRRTHSFRRNAITTIAVLLYAMFLWHAGMTVYRASVGEKLTGESLYDITDVDVGTQVIHAGKKFVVSDADLYDFSYGRDSIYIKLVEKQ